MSDLSSFLPVMLEDKECGLGKQPPVIFLIGDPCPSFFLSRLFAACAHPISFLDCAEMEIAQLTTCITSLFLGKRQRFWLGSLEQLPAQARKSLLVTLIAYQGPHRILCHLSAISQELKKKDVEVNIVQLPEHADDTFLTYFSLITRLSMPRKAQEDFLQVLKNRSLSLDEAFHMSYALTLAGSTATTQLIGTMYNAGGPHSLFDVSSAFFSGNATRFLKTWRQVKDDYPVQFWISFWSEQLFRAISYMYLMNAQRIVDAKQVAFRLPFSFIRSQWRQYDAHVLESMHECITRFDHEVKNGIDSDMLEHVLLCFFTA